MDAAKLQDLLDNHVAFYKPGYPTPLAGQGRYESSSAYGLHLSG